MATLTPVIIGPTASGKSRLGVEVATAFARRGFGGEIVSADAFQIYRGLDIGTAKPSTEERGGVAHHLIDIREPDDPEPYTVARWLLDATRAMEEIRGRGRVPIVVGGTHLYVQALVAGMFEGPAGDEAIRAGLRALEPGALRAELVRVDPRAAARIHPNDQRRTIRAIEVFRITGSPISELQTQWGGGAGREDVVLVEVRWSVEALNRRINARVHAMIERGLVEEVRGLYQGGKLGARAREALGYKQLVAWFEGGGRASELSEAVERIKIETRRFAKNQRTWLKRLAGTPGVRLVRVEGADHSVQDVVGQMFTE